MKNKSFSSFYSYYLTQHSDPVCRAFHFTGTLLSVLTMIWMTIDPTWWKLIIIPGVGYGFSWMGHFLFEKNKPAAFSNPFYSLISDFVMCFHFLTGQLNRRLKEVQIQN